MCLLALTVRCAVTKWMQAHADALLALKQRLVDEKIGLPQSIVIAGDLDATCFRFLRARKYNVGNAIAMLKSAVALVAWPSAALCTAAFMANGGEGSVWLI